MQVSSILDRNLKLFWTVFSIFLGLVCQNVASANLGPENCFLVVNGDSALSRRVANEYIQLRKIPSKNVLVLSGIKITRQISGDEFVSKMLKPILKSIEDRGLAGQIDCVIYSADFPTQCDIKKWAPKEDKYMRPTASTTSLTYLYRYSLAKSPAIRSLENNFYARRSPKVVLEQPFVTKAEANKLNNAIKLYEKKKYKEAKDSFSKLLKDHPYQCGLPYWIARCSAQLNEKTETGKHLIEAITRGWRFKEYTEKDKAFTKIKSSSVFKVALRSIKGVQWQFTNPVPFSSKITWAHSGFPDGSKGNANQYLLCIMLGVAFDEGNSEKEILSYLRRSAQIDNKGPKSGWFYFADTSDVRNKTRKPNYAAALKSLKALGYEGIIQKSVLPSKKGETLGATIGKSVFDWKKSKATLAAGAIGDNLTSHGGRFRKKNGQTTLSEFLRHGAAGASGTVIEPYALQSKFPLPSIHAYYASGFSLAEAFYLSVNGPYQLIIVGDALCQPYARPPRISVSGPAANSSVSGRVQFSPKFSGKKAKSFTFYFDGKAIRTLPVGKKVAFDSSRHPDGYHEIRIVANGADPAASKSRVIIPLEFKNHNKNCQFKATISGEQIKLQAVAKGAKSIEIRHHQEILHTSKKSKVTVNIPIKKVGKGPVTLQAVATIDGKTVQSAPITLQIKD